MDFKYKESLPTDFAADSRVWVYQSNRLLTPQEVLQTEKLLGAFAASWHSHGTPVKGHANLFFGQFIILMADESATGISGCSTDSSVRVLKQLEEQLNVSLFDRQLLAFIVKEKIELIPLSQLDFAFENQFISSDTFFFNNTVQTKSELQSDWIVPIKDSWLAKRIHQTKNSFP